MKVMKHKWCWIGLVICASSTAWGAKHNDDKSGSDTKKASSAESDSQDDATKDDATKDDATKDDATKDDSGDEDVAPNPPPKKAAKKAKTTGAPPQRTSTLNLGLLGSVGASPSTRLGLGLRGGLTMGATEGLYIGVIGTFFAGTSVTQPRLTGLAERTRNAIVTGVEVGYDVLASTDFLVRPYLSPGIGYVSDKTCATGDCWNDNGIRVTLAPGLQAIYSAGILYLGGDLRYQIIINTSDVSAAVISLTAGLRL